ncbi:uncharacterized protein ABDE67_020391 [Symphorus nematophorus]
MMIFALITGLLLCSLGCISVSGSESQAVEAQPGEEVTLLCSNRSISPGQAEWFRVINRTKAHCIASMYGSDGSASFCDGFQNGKFQMSSNMSSIFLKIQPVDLSDSGLYFCGCYVKGHIVISTATLLNVQGDGESDDEVDCSTQKEPDEMTILMTVILGGLIVILIIVITVLAVQIRKLQTAVNDGVQPERKKNVNSDDLNYVALSFKAGPKRKHRPASARELEPNVVYAATR